MVASDGPAQLRGRRREQLAIDNLLRAVSEGGSQALVLRGEAGIGKTALLDVLERRAGFARVIRVTGVESESEIAYSGLQQTCAPLLNHVGALAAPQRAALETAFGLSAGMPPERLLVGLAVLGLFAAGATAQPLVCIIDDAQWLDANSMMILGFVARRLDAESVGLVFAARTNGDDHALDGLPELRVEGLPDVDARAVLDSSGGGPIDPHVRDRIIAESRGNPLTLLWQPRSIPTADLNFGFGTPTGLSPVTTAEKVFRSRIAALRAETRTVLLTAAVEPLGDPTLLFRALEVLGVSADAAAPAIVDGLIEIGARVRFSHPLVRSVAWHSASPVAVRAAHAALAEATDAERDPDRRAWHRAHAAALADDDLADELERSAERARARAGWNASATFLEQSARLTVSAQDRGRRLIAAAKARLFAGEFRETVALVTAAKLEPLTDLDRAHAAQLLARATPRVVQRLESVAPVLEAARGLEIIDPPAARNTYLVGIVGAMTAGRNGSAETMAAANAARAARLPGDEAPDLLLRGLASFVLDPVETAAPVVQRALEASDSITTMTMFWHIAVLAVEAFRFDIGYRTSEQALKRVLDEGSSRYASSAMATCSSCLLEAGRVAEAVALDQLPGEPDRSVGSPSLGAKLITAALRGPAAEVFEQAEAQFAMAERDGSGRLAAAAQYARAMTANATGDVDTAIAAAQWVLEYPDAGYTPFVLRELADAAATGDRPDVLAEAQARLRRLTSAYTGASAQGYQALVDALAAEPESAEALFREAIELLTVRETRMTGIRARLLFGEWLWRQGRDAEAREVVQLVHDEFSEVGAQLLAERARRDLAAWGGQLRDAATDPWQNLTDREATIARLAVTGSTNREIGAALFLSPRTIEWHLGKVFSKLGVTSRQELAVTYGHPRPYKISA